MKNMNLSLSNISHPISLIALVAFMGLFYQVAWQYPVIDSFPLIERLLNPQFLTNDFYTNTFDAFSPRLILASCIAWISQTLDIHYTLVVAYLNIIRIWVYAIGLYLFFRELVNRDTALIALSFSSLSFLSVPFLPAWWPVTFDFTASNVALMFSMFAWVLILRKQVAVSLILLSLSVLFHPLVGVHSVLIAIILFLTYHNLSDFTQLFKQPPVYLAGLVYSIVFFALYLSFDKVLTADRFIEINGHYRHAHHFILSHMDLEKWISSFLMLGISTFLIFKLEISHKIRNITLVFFLYAIALTILGFLFIEVIPTRFMVSFIPMRAFPVIVPIMVLIWAIYAYQQFQARNYIGFLVLFLPFLPYQQVGLTWFLLPNHHDLTLPIIMIVFAFIYSVLSGKQPIITFGLNKVLNKLVDLASFLKAPSGFVLPISIMAILLSILKFSINIPAIEDEAPVYKWLQKNTAPSAVILSELNAANNQKIRLLANRAVVISKDFPFNEGYYEQWYDRYQTVYVERDSARGNIDNLDTETLSNLMSRYNSDLLLRTKELPSSKYFTLIGETTGETATTFIYRLNNEESTL